MLRTILPLGLVVVAVMVGCQANPEPTDPVKDRAVSLADRKWNLTELNGAPITPAEGNRGPHITFSTSDGRIAGSGGINRFMGTWSDESGKLTIMPGGMTMMAGPEPLMKQEQAFMRALGTVTGYRIDGRRLTLLAGETSVARFSTPD